MGVLGVRPALIERLAQAVHQGFDVRVGQALIDADERNAEPLAAMRQDLPVPQMKSADDERLRAGCCFVETLRRLEDDAVARRQRFDAKAFGEGSPKIFPHRRGDRLALAKRLFGEGQFEIRERALLSTEVRRDEAPEVPGEP